MAALAMYAGGCRFDDDLGVGPFQCEMEGICPNGMSCVAGVCRASSSGADASTDGANGVVPACGTLGALQDDFEDGTEEPQWVGFAGADASYDEADGVLTLKTGVAAEDRAAGYDTITSIPLGDAPDIGFEITEPPAGGALFFQLFADGATGGVWIVVDDEIHFEQEISGTVTTQATLTYQPSEHRWLQIRGNDSDGWDFLTSSDGQEFVQRAQGTRIDQAHRVIIGFSEKAEVTASATIELDDVGLWPGRPVFDCP